MPSQASTSPARCPACSQRPCICISVEDEQGSTATHTPLPWRITEDGDAIIARDDSIALLGSAKHKLANARLIAAAPELLMAVKDAIDFIGSIAADNESDHGELAMIRLLEKSVAKAEGQ